MEIDYSLYPKHNWEIDSSCFDVGFFTLICIDCRYSIRERFSGNTYIATYFDLNENLTDQIFYYDKDDDLDLIRKTLLSCDEVLIKKLLE